MTDINEIIGRAVHAETDIAMNAIDRATADRLAQSLPAAAVEPMGAAVVKALGEEGYVIGQKEADKPEMPIVRQYEDGSQIRAALGDNELHVNFEIWAGLGPSFDVEVRGFVKWDGCMNWETSPRCMYHFCSKADAEQLTALFKDVWDEGRKLMPRADAGYGE